MAEIVVQSVRKTLAPGGGLATVKISLLLIRDCGCRALKYYELTAEERKKIKTDADFKTIILDVGARWFAVQDSRISVTMPPNLQPTPTEVKAATAAKVVAITEQSSGR